MTRTIGCRSSRRLLHIVGGSGFGGASLVIESLACAAQEAGWQVDVLTTNPRLVSVLLGRGIGVLDIDVIRRPVRPCFDLRGTMLLARELRQRSYDLVHTHTSKAGFVGRLAAHLAGIRNVVHTVHGFAFHEASCWATIRTYSSLERLAARWCDHIVTVSEFHRTWALQLGICHPSKITAIPNGIGEVGTGSARPAREVRAELGVPADAAIFLALGRLEKGKGLESLVRAVAQLRQRSPTPFVLAIAGDGAERSRLERLVTQLNLAADIRLLGFRDDVADLLAACDVIVLPSIREGMSISLLEAMSAAKPMIVSTIGSNREATMNGECAVLVSPNSVGGLSTAMADLLRSPSRGAAMAVRARARYVQCYTERRMTDSYLRVYEQVVANSVGSANANSLRENWVNEARGMGSLVNEKKDANEPEAGCR
jgi:glycosyltransferase involved in cell wall biosynthesis